ncbi:hypothetical protein GCM10012320_08160 [Sinomonas cellulolyticus]|uniref:Lipoprotein n=1 Tax=Sinomonas cellulolyticus TaxID=2801916 RepID=A0ABS1K3L5_9MICC|nr:MULTISPECIES: hypothetical protein [Sinomonas]MBL0706279.1 hypothetical protein [Sinomonas cellulolyticus]GHG43829.1 hypothetical protein GCM10012320_08160 [Sinomonas sp. KCTC 49339]
MNRTITLAAIATLALAGCSASPAANETRTTVPAAPSAAPSSIEAVPESSGPGEYQVTLGAAHVVVTVPSEPDPAAIALGIPAGSWVKVDIDNRNGAKGTRVYTVALTDAAGKRTVYTSPDKLLEGMDKSKLPAADYNKMIRWANEADSWTEPGERRTAWLAAVGPVPEFVRVDVADSGMNDPVKAIKQ